MAVTTRRCPKCKKLGSILRRVHRGQVKQYCAECWKIIDTYLPKPTLSVLEKDGKVVIKSI